MYQVICVGAIYLDTILTVPHYPDEDKKLRATNLFVRRGGNCGNTLEVLEQLVNRRGSLERLTEKATENIDSPLHLIAVLPAKDSEAVATVQASFKYLKLDPACIYRPDSTTAASSYIIRSQENGSRTIVSYTALEEMTVREFEEQAALVLSHTGAERGWFHFEVQES
jgi:ketohexokinase